MRVLAVTLGRPSRPRHDSHIQSISRKEEAKSLIDDDCSKMREDRGVGKQGLNGGSTVLRYNPNLSGRSEDKTVPESSKRLINGDQNEAKSARVIRVPRETMSAHRSKLVRNSSINKWRAKFRRPPLTSETATETDTEQLLDETEKNVKTSSKPERGGRDVASPKGKTTPHAPPSSSNNDQGSTKRDKCSNYLNMAKSKNNSVLSRDTAGTGARQAAVEWGSSGVGSKPQEWSGVSPPRSVTPHRVQLRGEFIPWVGPISQRDSDSPRYLPMNGGHASSALSTPQPVGGSSASCHRVLPSAERPSRTAPQGHVGSWPRPSRTTIANAEEGVYKTPSELCPRPVCPSSPARSDLVRSNAASGSNSHFGTFPRRRLSQKGKYAISAHCFN